MSEPQFHSFFQKQFDTAEQITSPSNAGFCSWRRDSQEGNRIVNAPGQKSREL